MKRILSVFILTFVMFSMVACETDDLSPVVETENENREEIKDEKLDMDPVKEDVLTIENYYPFNENIIMDYEGIGNEYAEQKTFIEFIGENRAQIKVVNPGSNTVKVMEYKDGKLKEIYSEGEFYHIENMLDINSTRENIVLQEPIEIGNSWSTENGDNKSITAIDASIETPSGTYKALEVTTEISSGEIQKDYFAEGIGLVATIYKDGDFEVKTLLKEIIEDNKSLEILAYYPTFEDIGTKYIRQNIEFATNDKIENILEQVMKRSPNDQLIAPLSEKTKIKKIKVNKESNNIEVDFSQELLTEMNAGSGFEWEIIRSIVNTLGDFYNVEKVYISVEGKPYESGHYAIDEDEFFQVDKEDISQYK